MLAGLRGLSSAAARRFSLILRQATNSPAYCEANNAVLAFLNVDVNIHLPRTGNHHMAASWSGRHTYVDVCITRQANNKKG